MKKYLKKIVSMIIVATLLCAFSITAFSGAPNGNFHKVNGISSEDGRSGSYTSTITKTCTKITAYGTSDNGRKSVTLHIYSSSNKLVASKVLILDGIERECVYYHTTSFSPGTYRIEVSSSDSVPYEVSTSFYQ